MNSKGKTLLLILFSILFLVIIFWLVELSKVLDVIKNIDIRFMLYAFGMMFIVDFINAIKMNMLVDYPISMKFIFRMFFINQRTIFLSQFLPSNLLGVGYRTQMLTEYTSEDNALYKIMYDKYTSFISTLFLSFISFIALLFLWGHTQIFYILFGLIAFVVFIVVILNIGFFQKVIRLVLPENFTEVIIDRAERVKDLVGLHQSFFKFVIMSAVIFSLQVLSVKLLAFSLGIKVDYLALIIAITIVTIIIMIPLAYAGFGLRELTLMTVLYMIMVPFESGLVLSVLILILSLVKSIWGGLLFFLSSINSQKKYRRF